MLDKISVQCELTSSELKSLIKAKDLIFDGQTHFRINRAGKPKYVNGLTVVKATRQLVGCFNAVRIVGESPLVNLSMESDQLALLKIAEYLNIQPKRLIVSKCEFGFNLSISKPYENYTTVFGTQAKKERTLIEDSQYFGYKKGSSKVLTLYDKAKKVYDEDSIYKEAAKGLNLARIEVRYTKRREILKNLTLDVLMKPETLKMYAQSLLCEFADIRPIAPTLQMSKEDFFDSAKRKKAEKCIVYNPIAVANYRKLAISAYNRGEITRNRKDQLIKVLSSVEKELRAYVPTDSPHKEIKTLLDSCYIQYIS